MPSDGRSATEISSRLFRLVGHVEQMVGRIYAKYGLNRPEADLLSTLLRAGKPMPASYLAASVMCSTGTMTNRLDRLERDGMVRRRNDPDDRRGVLIGLTPQGRKAIEAAIAEREAVDAELIPGLSSKKRQALVGLLRESLLSLETQVDTRTKGSRAARKHESRLNERRSVRLERRPGLAETIEQKSVHGDAFP